MVRIRHILRKVSNMLRNRQRGWAAVLTLFCASMLTACGTDVGWLLTRDSELVAEADKATTAADAVDPDLATPVYDAEDVKRDACQSIYASISDLMQRKPSFGEQLVSDLGLFIAFFVPIDEIERCAEAQAVYAAAIDDLKGRLRADTTTSN